jgi:hypothetical protein
MVHQLMMKVLGWSWFGGIADGCNKTKKKKKRLHCGGFAYLRSTQKETSKSSIDSKTTRNLLGNDTARAEASCRSDKYNTTKIWCFALRRFGPEQKTASSIEHHHRASERACGKLFASARVMTDTG